VTGVTPAPPGGQWTDPGQAESDFLLAVRRFAGPGRGIGLVLVSVFGVLATPTGALPLGYVLLGLAVVGGVADVYAGWTGRGERTALVLALVRVGAICVSQQWTAPVPGEINQWVLNTLTITAITLQWEWPPSVTVPALAGLLAVSLPTLGADDSVTTDMRVVIESVLARLAFLLLLRSAREVDRLRERQVRLERAEALALARRRQEREYLALLHDTASATFLMIAAHGGDSDPAEVAGYARRDLAILTGSSGSDGYNGLVAVESSLRPLAEQSPLEVDARWDRVPLVPVSVALALVRALSEALVNVERHAEVTAVALHVMAEDGGVVVTVTDTGRGFDPGAVAGNRHGIRGSMVERMSAVGGSAVVTSTPGAGTTVRLAWSDG
jgi:histidine kinase/DNA gyrase B/HSP90-like ATPase